MKDLAVYAVLLQSMLDYYRLLQSVSGIDVHAGLICIDVYVGLLEITILRKHPTSTILEKHLITYFITATQPLLAPIPSWLLVSTSNPSPQHSQGPRPGQGQKTGRARHELGHKPRVGRRTGPQGRLRDRMGSLRCWESAWAL